MGNRTAIIGRVSMIRPTGRQFDPGDLINRKFYES